VQQNQSKSNQQQELEVDSIYRRIEEEEIFTESKNELDEETSQSKRLPKSSVSSVDVTATTSGVPEVVLTAVWLV